MKTGNVLVSDLAKGSSHADYATLQSLCLDSSSSAVLFAEPTSADVYRLVYQVDDVDVVNKSVQLASSGGNGAIIATGYFVINGGVEIWPDVTGNLINGDQECVAITYADEIEYIHSGGAEKLETLQNEPKMKNPVAGAKCHSSTATSLSTTKSTSEDKDKSFFKNDFVKDTSIDPFESFFQQPRSAIDTVKNDYSVIQGVPVNCDQKIANEFASTDMVWVEGDCDLGDGHDLTGLPATPRTLVIENGLFGVYSAVKFYGAIYHLNTEPATTDFSARWANMASGPYLGPANPKDVAHYQGGAFESTGALIIDVPYKKSYFNNSMKFIFDPDAKGGGGSNIYRYSWRKGSWNDL